MNTPREIADALPGLPGAIEDLKKSVNSFSSYAALQASDPAKRSAFLVGDTDASPRPDGAYTNSTGTAGGWVAQPADGVIFKQSLANTAYLSVTSKLRNGEVSVMDGFGISADPSVDATAGVQLAVNALKDAGGGVLRLPRRILLVDSITHTPENGRGVSIRGEGRRASYVRKIANNAAPVFDWVAAPGQPTETYVDFSDFAVHGYNTNPPAAGPKTADAFRFTKMAKFTMSRVDVRDSLVAVRLLGSLVCDFDGCNFQRSRVGILGGSFASGGVTNWPNAVNVHRCVLSECSDYAVDWTGSGFHIKGGDIEACGTAGLATSGGLIFREGCDDEIGSGFASVEDVWFEANKGTGVSVEANLSANFTLAMRNTQIIAQEAGRDMSIASGLITLESHRSPSPGGKLAFGAGVQAALLRNVYAGIIEDALPADRKLYEFVNTADGFIGSNGGSTTGYTVALNGRLHFRAQNGAVSQSIYRESNSSRLTVDGGGIGFDAGAKQWAGNLPTYANSSDAATAMGSGWLFRRPDNLIGVS